MAVESIIPELSWFCTFLFLVVVVMLVATCVCSKEHDKSPEYGTAGRLSITKDSPVLHHQQLRNGASCKQVDVNVEEGSHKRNSWTVKDRALPEIPGAIMAPVMSHSEAIESAENLKVKSHNKAPAPRPPSHDPSKVFPMNGSALIPTVESGSGVTVTITVNSDKSHGVSNSSTTSERTIKPRVPVLDSVASTSSNMVVLKKVEKKESSDSPSKQGQSSDNFYDTVPEINSGKGSRSESSSSSPVCIKVINSASPSEEGASSNLSASLAVAGGVPSSDIPYMTPPLPHTLPSALVNEETDSNETGGRSEVPYTVISVREPLARVREITMRRQRAVAAAAIHQNSEENENHYAMVPEEEQMYAEIGSGHDSGSSSITYAHIEPRELPPVPPTVESLKSVAHAHSRQASTVSTSSLGSSLSNTGETSPPTLRNPSTSLYSTVDKNPSQRKTIHVAEGVSLVASTDKKKKVEDLYAKVRKKRVELTIKTDDYGGYEGVHEDGGDCMTPPPSPWASTTPPAPPPIAGRLQAASLNVLVPGCPHHVRRHSADPNLPEVINENQVFPGGSRASAVEEPDYEKIYNEGNSGESCYEKIKEGGGDGADCKADYVSKAWPKSPSRTAESAFPGYESVKDLNEDEDSLDPGYECVAQGVGSENDPGYEPVRISRNFDDSDSNSDYTVVKLDDVKEPGYETVKKLGRTESDAADPGYERIKKVPRAGSDATDPGYERVRNKDEDVTEPGYETVQRSDSDTDPGYEVVPQNRSFSSRYGNRNTSHPREPSSSSGTVVFVSGNSQVHISNGSNVHDQTLESSNESNATFL